MLPVRDARQQHLVEIAEDVGERLGVLGRRGRQPGADVAGRDLRQHRQLADALEVPRRPLQRRGPVLSEAQRFFFRSFSICGQVRVLTTSSFVSQPRRAWPTPSSR